MRKKTIEISPEVAEVLAGCTVQGSADRPAVILPQGQLDRGLYQSVDKVLKALGGKWDRRAGGHVFPAAIEGQLAELMADALATGEVLDRKKTFEQFFTPEPIADRMAELACLRGQVVLEPSAGAGALIMAARRAGAKTIRAIELDHDLAQALLADGNPAKPDGLWRADFMQWEPDPHAEPFGAVLMNPPFSRNQDIAHVRRAFDLLDYSGTLAAIMSPHWTFAQDAPSIEFRRWLGVIDRKGPEGQPIMVPAPGGPIWEAVWHPLPEGSFATSGTGVGAGILELQKAPF